MRRESLRESGTPSCGVCHRRVSNQGDGDFLFRVFGNGEFKKKAEQNEDGTTNEKEWSANVHEFRSGNHFLESIKTTASPP